MRLEMTHHWGTVVLLLLTRLLATVLGNVEDMPEYLVEEDEIDCADENTPSLPYTHIPWNTPFRAFRSLPRGLRIDESTIPEGGLGVYCDTFIRKFTWLAEYEGEIVIKLYQISDYAWKVKRHGKKSFYVDAHDVATSNWLRWINCSRTKKEENVDVFACKGKTYYVANRDIYPGEEFLVYYGDGYAKDLHIDVDNYDNAEQIASKTEDQAICDTNCSDSKSP